MAVRKNVAFIGYSNKMITEKRYLPKTILIKIVKNLHYCHLPILWINSRKKNPILVIEIWKYEFVSVLLDCKL